MAKINSKAKGSSAERDIAKLFSTHLGGSFTKSISSGAFIGGKNSIRKENLSESQIRSLKSDIYPPDEYTRLVTEVKFYKELDFAYSAYVGVPNTLISGWLKELDYDCDDNDVGVLCFRTNRQPWSIAIPIRYLHLFPLKHYLVHDQYFITSLSDILNNHIDTFKAIIKDTPNV